MSEWREVQLQNLVSKLGDGLHGTPIYSDEGKYYFINGNNLKDGKIVVDEKTKCVSDVEYHKYKKDLTDRTILVSINGTLGNVAYYSGENVVLGKSACYFNVNNEVDKDFVRYVMSSRNFQYYIEKFSTGTTIKNFSLKSMREFTFMLPPLPEQHQIAAILSTLDAKIDLLRQQNHTLEKITQMLFNRWFVAFEFPVAMNSEERIVNGEERIVNSEKRIVNSEELFTNHYSLSTGYKSSGGAMVASELGEIPEGWRVGSFLDIFNLLSGGTPKTSIPEYWDGTIKWLSGKDVTASHRKFILNTEKQITKEGLNNSATKLLPKFTTVISARGTVGCYCLLSEPMCMSQTSYGIKAKSEDINFFTYLSVSYIVKKLKSQAYGSVFNTITTSTFKQAEIVIPPQAIQLQFETLVTPIFKKILANEIQIKTLTRLRDTLLPKLMSGNLRVKT